MCNREGDDFARAGGAERAARFEKRRAGGGDIVNENDVAARDQCGIGVKTAAQIIKPLRAAVGLRLARGVFYFCEREGEGEVTATPPPRLRRGFGGQGRFGPFRRHHHPGLRPPLLN